MDGASVARSILWHGRPARALAALAAGCVLWLKRQTHVRDARATIMRVIAGEFRGRTLIAPGNDATRPITDRAKQSLFDILAPTIADSLVYDCFSGTGSMGLECLSRGAKFATFFDADRTAIARLNQNIVALGVQTRSRVVQGDLFKWFELANKRPDSANASGADIVFLDPPYRFLKQHSDELLQLALHLSHSHLKPEGIVVFRHDVKDELPLPNLPCFDRREYGEMVIEMLRAATTPITNPND